MELAQSRSIAAPPDAVWQALNDPAVLQQCIPGCESLERVSDHQWRARVALRIGPVQARFNGHVQLADLIPPSAYTLRFDGQGGAAGFASGEARVTLTPDGDATVLAYEAQAKVGGKLVQLGSRLIDGVAAKLADDFFNRLSQRLGTATPGPAADGGAARAGAEGSGPAATSATIISAEIATAAPALATSVAPPGGRRAIRYLALAAIAALLGLLYWYRGR